MFIVYDKHTYNLIWANPMPLEQVPETEQEVYFQFKPDQHGLICAATREAGLNELLELEAGTITEPRITLADLQADAAAEKESAALDTEHEYIKAVRSQLTDKHAQKLSELRRAATETKPLPRPVEPSTEPENRFIGDFTALLNAKRTENAAEAARIAEPVPVPVTTPQPADGAIFDIDETNAE